MSTKTNLKNTASNAEMALESIKKRIADGEELTQEIMEQIWGYIDAREHNPALINICKLCGNHVQSEVHGICRRDRVEVIIGKCECEGTNTVKEAFEKYGDVMFASCANCQRYTPAKNFNPDPDEVQAILRSRS